MLGDAGPRSQRRLPIDADQLRRVEALHMSGTNLNQIAKNGIPGTRLTCRAAPGAQAMGRNPDFMLKSWANRPRHPRPHRTKGRKPE